MNGNTGNGQDWIIGVNLSVLWGVLNVLNGVYLHGILFHIGEKVLLFPLFRSSSGCGHSNGNGNLSRVNFLGPNGVNDWDPKI